MFDRQKLRQLEQRSHNRGLLSKQFFQGEQQELERKRREMKQELDRQVEEKRRVKQNQKMEQQRKMKREEEEIKNYYNNLENRQKKFSSNDSQGLQASHMKYTNQPYQTYPNQQQHQSRYQAAALQQRSRGHSKPNLIHDGDIPLMSAMPIEYSSNSTVQQNGVLVSSKQSQQNIGSIPLLDLSDDPGMANKFKKNKQKTTKREKTLQTVKEYQPQKIQKQKVPQRKQATIATIVQPQREQRKSTLADEQSMVGSIVHGNSAEKRKTQFQQIQQEIEGVEQQNRVLKMELKKNQQALTLLIGAVRSNGKLDKYRVQAQKILSGGLQQSMASRKQQQKEQERLMLPKITLRHQSILHDYLISAARRGKKIK